MEQLNEAPDGTTGEGTAWTLPSGAYNGATVAAAAAGPIIDAEGAVQLVAGQWSGGTGWYDSRLMRVTLPEGGGLQVRDVATTPEALVQQHEDIRDYRLLPDGQGGLLWVIGAWTMSCESDST